MKKIFVLLLSVYGCIASAQKNPPVTKAWAAPTPVTNAGVANELATPVPVTNEWATHALIMNALATNTRDPIPPVTSVPVTNAPEMIPVAIMPVTNTAVSITFATSVPVTNTAVTNEPVSIAPVTNMPVLNTAVAHPAATNAPARPVALDIISDHWDFDQSLRQTVYRGHVRVTDAQMRLVCEQLTAIFPEKNAKSGGHLEQVQAETNVVIDFTDEQGEKYHVTAAKAVYAYHVVNSMTNETVTLTGSPKVTWGNTNSVTGEPLYYTRINRQKGSVHGDNMKTFFVSPPAGTNTDATPLKLF
jgi:lipopolysaccharide export system protein LptA